MTTSDWLELDRTHVWHPYTQMKTAPAPLAIERAEGVWLQTTDGRRILDGISSWWVNIHGHGHPRLNRALREQTEKLQQVIFAGCTHEPAARLAARLVDVTPPGLGHAFYSDDGSTAVEVGLKLAAQYHVHRGDDKRTVFIALADAYHGDTFGTMAAGGVATFHGLFAPWLFEVRHACAPHGYDDPRDPTTLRADAAGDGDLETILASAGDRVAAVVIEPMLQGAGGMRVWPVEFLRRVRELCDRFGVLLIADEVFTGFGRTGKLFACEHGPIVPDILCLSKAITGGYLPLAATLSTDAIFDAFLSDDRGRTFFHGHSYTANALACAVAVESLAIIEDEDVMTRVGEIERLFAARLERYRSHPAVADARGIGGLAALELAPTGRDTGYLDALGPRLYDEFLARDILLRPLGNCLYFLPPYVITDDEAHRVFDAIDEVLDIVSA